ncbi:hypothetical protein [Leucobacter salsicius]|uniref:hypothetical protein n=1 Tax=Leucobacter salsicius TaxID=664638 RepID=UPI000347C3A0|nr:hypothetical protein [Leucobacter salsicius]
MQLGARWRAGEEPHRGVPPVLYSAIAEQEAAHPAASAWTLTFLEGRPRCALDDAVTVTLDAAGSVVVEGGLGLTADRFSQGTATVEGVPDDGDDDWLS